jgi:hypothetical protein
MKISIKEAYSAAISALPGYNVEVSVSLGSTWKELQKNKENIWWDISIRKTGDDNAELINEKDHIFAIALAKVSAEASRKDKTPIDDVEAENPSKEDELPAELPDQPEGTDNSHIKDLPF